MNRGVILVPKELQFRFKLIDSNNTEFVDIIFVEDEGAFINFVNALQKLKRRQLEERDFEYDYDDVYIELEKANQ